MSTSTPSASRATPSWPGSPTGSVSPSGPPPPPGSSAPESLSPELRWELIRRIEEYQQAATRHSAAGLIPYLHFVTVDSRPEAKPFRQLAEPWQWRQANTLAPALESVAGLRPASEPTRFWLTLPRGHDKSSSIGRYCNWLCGFARRRNLRLYVASGDRDQAAQVADFMRVEGELNPWLAARVRHQSHTVHGLTNAAQLKILAADAASSYGGKPDVLVCDELTHWPKRDLWDALYSGMEKRPGSVVVVITNAGEMGSWQWEVLKAAKTDPRWLVYEPPGPLASWMAPDRVAALRAMLPKAVGDRVLGNRWIDPAEAKGFITRDESAAAVALGRRLGLSRQLAGRPGTKYFAAVDYGLVKDRTVLCVCHRIQQGEHAGTLVLDRMDVWQGQHGSPVRADDVMEWLVRANRDFHQPHFVVDPYQLAAVIQRLPQLDIETFEYRGGKGNYEAASNLLGLARGGRLALYPGAGEHGDGTDLAEELYSVVLKTTPYGYRIDHEASAHDDRVTALAMAALAACKAEAGQGVAGDLLSELWF